MFGTLGVQEMMIIFFVALVLFGPKKLPELGKTIGKALTEFRKHSNDLKSTFEREMNNLEKETESVQQVASSTANQIRNSIDVDPYQHWMPAEDHPAEIAAGDAQDTHQPPETVGASEVTGAELNEATEVAAIEGTVPRKGTASAAEQASETPQHT